MSFRKRTFAENASASVDMPCILCCVFLVTLNLFCCRWFWPSLGWCLCWCVHWISARSECCRWGGQRMLCSGGLCFGGWIARGRQPGDAGTGNTIATDGQLFRTFTRTLLLF